MTTAMLVFAGALVIPFGAPPPARRIAPRLGVMDIPGPRKVHARPMPLLGGAAIVLASIATLLIFENRFEFYKLLGQVLAAGILIISGVKVQVLPSDIINIGITLVWIVGLTNSLNLLDNMDGLSGGVAAGGAAFFMVMAAVSKQNYVGALG